VLRYTYDEPLTTLDDARRMLRKLDLAFERFLYIPEIGREMDLYA
jgi:hypothetical protein